MDTLWPIFVAAGALLCTLTAAACHWWHGKRLSALGTRLAKSERAREYAVQQASQARKQIEKLQRELSAVRRPPPTASAPNSTVAARFGVPAAPRHAEFESPRLPPNGFADTQPL